MQEEWRTNFKKRNLLISGMNPTWQIFHTLALLETVKNW
jgi:hypothetical protein